MTRQRYLFFIAWISGSDGACGESTGVHECTDLEKEFFKGNPHVNAYEVHADCEDTARALAYREAFMTGYQANDSVSDLIPFPYGTPAALPRELSVLQQTNPAMIKEGAFVRGPVGSAKGRVIECLPGERVRVRWTDLRETIESVSVLTNIPKRS